MGLMRGSHHLGKDQLSTPPTKTLAVSEAFPGEGVGPSEVAVGGGRSTLEGKGTHTTNKGEEDWGEGGFLTQPRSPGGRRHLS